MIYLRRRHTVGMVDPGASGIREFTAMGDATILGEIKDYLQKASFMDDGVSIDDTLSLSGSGIIDSIGIIGLIDFIQEKYTVEIPEDQITLENFDTLRGICNLIEKLTP